MSKKAGYPEAIVLERPHREKGGENEMPQEAQRLQAPAARVSPNRCGSEQASKECKSSRYGTDPADAEQGRLKLSLPTPAELQTHEQNKCHCRLDH